MDNFMSVVKQWQQPPFDASTQNAVIELQQHPELLEDAFYKNLEFGTGGMRGIMGVGTNRINKYTIGKNTQGLSNYLKQSFTDVSIKVVIAYDCRNNSKELAKVVADVFTANRIHCYLFSDFRPTPELSFAVRYLKAHCGIILTASHNPPEYNGYKVYWSDGGQIVPPQDEEIAKAIDQTQFEDINFNSDPNMLYMIDAEIDNAYYKTVLSLAKLSQNDRSSVKIVFTPLHGTSIVAIPQALKLAGYTNVHIVQEQAKPDGNFPTVESPNPEEPEALSMAVEQAKSIDADIVIGTDPDADRLGIAVRIAKNNYLLLNGNQVMMIMTEYLLDHWSKSGRLNGNQCVATTIVSSPVIKKMAEANGVYFKECLTGFKWIAKLINDFPELEFIGSGEESFGYLVGSAVRDKDAVSAALLACEIAVDTRSKALNFMDLLVSCYKKYGFYLEHLVSVTEKGRKGAAIIAETMEKYRTNPPLTIAEIPVLKIEDLKSGMSVNLKYNKQTPIDLPRSDVLIFWLEDGSKIAMRLSGTEPKIKFYFSVNNMWNPNASWQGQKDKLALKIKRLQEAIAI